MAKIKENPAEECLESIKDGVLYCLKNECEGDKILLYGFPYPYSKNQFNKNFKSYKELFKLINSATSTDTKHKTEFPDFVCDNGIVEHFDVTATKETKKGSDSKICQANEDRKLANEIKQDINDDECKDIYANNCNFPIQTKDDFVRSFKKNWENHIESLQKYKTEHNPKIVCFLIESDCYGLKMQIKPDLSKYNMGLRTGHLLENYICNPKEKFPSIMLGRCKCLLEYIYNFREEVQYVIFKTLEYIEIIKTDEAQYIASILHEYEYQGENNNHEDNTNN